MIWSPLSVAQNTETKKNACIAKLTEHFLANYDKDVVAPNLDTLVKTVFESCRGDADAMDILTADGNHTMGTLIRSNSHTRTEDELRRRVGKLCDSLDELRSLAEKTPGVYEHGKVMLMEIGKGFAPGLFSALVKIANEVSIDRLLNLSRSSKPLEIHMAVKDIYEGVEKAMVSSGVAKKLDGATEKDPARRFVVDVMLARCGKGALETIKSVLTSKGNIMQGYYENYGDDDDLEAQTPAMQDAIKATLTNCSGFLMRIAGSVHANLARFSPGLKQFTIHHETGTRIGMTYERAQQIDSVVKEMAVDYLKEDAARTIDLVVDGGGAGANAIKRILHQKLDGIFDTHAYLVARRQESVATMLNWAICGEMKKLAEKDFSSFKEALERTGTVSLQIDPKNSKQKIALSKNVNDAMDQLAQFVTGDQKAKYDDNLELSVRNQIHYMMAMLSRTTEEAGETGAQIAMHDHEVDPAFTAEEDTRPGMRRIERNFLFVKEADGGFDMEFTMNKPVFSVKTGEQTINVGDGSSIHMGLRVPLHGERFKNFMAQDFSKFDDAEMMKVFKKKGDGNKLEKVQDAIPKKEGDGNKLENVQDAIPQVSFKVVKVNAFKKEGDGDMLENVRNAIPQAFKVDLLCSVDLDMKFEATEQENRQQFQEELQKLRDEGQMRDGNLIIQG